MPPCSASSKTMKINPEFITRILTSFIREELAKFHFTRGILGLSGGLDSATSAGLAARALGKDNVLAFIMPYGSRQDKEVEDAEEVADSLGIATRRIDISPMVDAYYRLFPTEDRILKGNKMARERMSILYDFSARERALIIGTSNKTELLLGYGTIHGDMASAINPIGDLYKTQVRTLAAHLGISAKILKKAPSAGLWPGQTDEEELGLSYDLIDTILYQLIDLRKPKNQIIEEGHDPDAVERIIHLIKSSEFKRKPPQIVKLSHRTVGVDFLYPYDWDK
jgi:NAD+ synthase